MITWRLLLGSITASLALQPSQAQVSEVDLEAAGKTRPVITDQDLERARQRYRAPTEAELKAALPAVPNLDALPVPSARTIDLEGLAKSYEANRDRMAQAQGITTEPRLFAFISLAMPEASLVRLIEQAARTDTVLVLRGLENGSIRETMRHVQRLIGKHQVAVQINPQAFDRFAVTKVPTLVLAVGGMETQACGNKMCVPAEAYAALAGDVSIDYALEYIERTSTRFGSLARTFLDRLRNGS